MSKLKSDSSSLMGLFFATVWDILTDALKNYRFNGDVNMAAAIAFYFIFSIIPIIILSLLAISFIFGFNPNIQDQVIRVIQEFHPYFSEQFVEHMGQIEQTRQLLGWLGIVSLVWSSLLIFNAIQIALRVILPSQKSQNFIVATLLPLVMFLTGWFVIVTTVGTTYLTNVLAEQPLIVQKIWFIYTPAFRYFLPYAVVVFFFTLIYKIVPAGKVSWGSAFFGSALFAALTEVSKHLFTWYISASSRYHIIYGSLETLLILIIWVFYVALIFLFCAEIISSYQKRDLILLEKAFLQSGKES